MGLYLLIVIQVRVLDFYKTRFNDHFLHKKIPVTNHEYVSCHPFVPYDIFELLILQLAKGLPVWS